MLLRQKLYNKYIFMMRDNDYMYDFEIEVTFL